MSHGNAADTALRRCDPGNAARGLLPACCLPCDQHSCIYPDLTDDPIASQAVSGRSGVAK